MINLESVVSVVVYLLVAGAVFGLLFYLINYIAGAFPSEPMTMFAKVARVILVVIAILVLIGLLISLVGGTPMFYWGSPHRL